MECTQFYEYVILLLREAGHMFSENPVYFNHSSVEAIYIDSEKNVVTNNYERQLLSTICNVSLLTEISWTGIVDALNENIQLYSITVDYPTNNCSDKIADIHYLLQQYWDCTHSIIFFQNKNRYIISFANNECSHILSDWYDIYYDDAQIINKLSIGNMSTKSSNEYFFDFIFTLARPYYAYPISFEEASYGMLPLDCLSSLLIDDIPVTKDELKEMIRQNIMTYRNIYGEDYVDIRFNGSDKIRENHNLSEEIDRISFELELADNDEKQVGIFDEADSNEDDLFDENDDMYKNLDPAIFDDPTLMVKWLEKNNAT